MFPQTLLDESITMVPYGQLYPDTTTDNPASSAIIFSPSMTIFDSEQEMHYFRFYHNTTAQQLSGVSTLMEWYHERVD